MQSTLNKQKQENNVIINDDIIVKIINDTIYNCKSFSNLKDIFFVSKQFNKCSHIVALDFLIEEKSFDKFDNDPCDFFFKYNDDNFSKGIYLGLLFQKRINIDLLTNDQMIKIMKSSYSIIPTDDLAILIQKINIKALTFDDYNTSYQCCFT